MANGLDAHVGTVAVCCCLNCSDGFSGAGVHRMRGAELTSPLELAVIEVDTDDGGGSGKSGSSDGCVAHAAAAKHRNAVAPLHFAGEHRCSEAGHNTTAKQTRNRW